MADRQTIHMGEARSITFARDVKVDGDYIPFRDEDGNLFVLSGLEWAAHGATRHPAASTESNR